MTALEDIKRHLSELPDEELWRVVREEASQYRDDALELAHVEIKRRGMSAEQIKAMPIEWAYEGEWTELRRRRNLNWLGYITYIPGALIVGLMLGRLIGYWKAGLVAFVIWGIIVTITMQYLLAWRWPSLWQALFWLAADAIHVRATLSALWIAKVVRLLPILNVLLASKGCQRLDLHHARTI